MITSASWPISRISSSTYASSLAVPQLTDLDLLLDFTRQQRALRSQQILETLQQTQQSPKNKTEVFMRGRFLVAAVAFARFEEVALLCFSHAD